MLTNFEIDIMRSGGFDRSIRIFKRISRPIEGAVKRKSRFMSSQDRRNRDKKRARKSARLSSINGLSNLSLCVVQMKDEEVKHELRVPMVQNRVPTREVRETRTPAPTVVSARSEAALTIVEFDSLPPEVVVLKDADKDLLRFPFGMRDVEDLTLFATARRECLEEAFFGLDVELPEFTGENSLGVISVSVNHNVGIFHIVLPADTPINPGEEQEEAFRVPIAIVDKYVARGLFSQTHCVAWDLYKKKIPPLRAGAG